MVIALKDMMDVAEGRGIEIEYRAAFTKAKCAVRAPTVARTGRGTETAELTQEGRSSMMPPQIPYGAKWTQCSRR